ncbi:hypothetical protein NKDENANG_03470 [Candidatus Entotheonellaceae bacterium PAL068K]
MEKLKRYLEALIYKANAEVRCDASESAGQSLTLAPWGRQRVRRKSPRFFGDQEDPPAIDGWTSHLAWVQLAHGYRLLQVLPSLFRQGHVRAKNRLRRDAGSRPSVGMITEDYW